MIKVYTDGSSSRKFNTIGSGLVIYKDNEEIYRYKIGFKGTFKTGASELFAILFSLEYLINNGYKEEEIEIYSDSQYVVYELTKYFYSHLQTRFYEVKNVELITNILYKKSLFKNLKILWIKGHDGIEENELVDKLAKSAHREDCGANLEDLIDFDSFINIIDEVNLEHKYFERIYQFYLHKKV